MCFIVNVTISDSEEFMKKAYNRLIEDDLVINHMIEIQVRSTL